jgi:KDO2-lipid IV(A) lauroyltransferase
MKCKIIKKIKNDFIYLLVVFISTIWRILPRKAGLFIFGTIGKIIYMLPTKDKRLCKEHLKFIFTDKLTDKQISYIALKVYQNLGKNLFDALYFSNKNSILLSNFIEYDDITTVWEEYNKKRGVIILTAHLGCFEMLLHFFASQGFLCFAIGREIYDKRIDEIVKKYRSGENIIYLHRTGNLKKFLKLLSEGRMFGVLIDQDTNVDGVFSHFLGRIAYTPCGAVKLAMRYNIPVFVVLTARLNNEKHKIFIKKIDLILNGDFEKCLLYNIEEINNIISSLIVKYPDQWVWMHKRWNKKPTDVQYQNIPNIEKI